MVESYDGASFNRWQLFFDRHKNSLNFLVNFHHFLGNVPWRTVSFRESRWIFSFWWLNLCSSKWDHFLKIIGVKRKNIWNHNLENVEKLDSNCLLYIYIYHYIYLCDITVSEGCKRLSSEWLFFISTGLLYHPYRMTFCACQLNPRSFIPIFTISSLACVTHSSGG